ncbi:type II toxin-antitoxin system RelE family toxin [Methanobrevibacter curvatus]|uniref:Plasmid stabilization system protein n=1 Tax=Methanobrevibacter curvatus TaxID=49547 RepID=A0A165Z5N4_9EURY|nr:hypothetical protein [Methanobrevibacter curvatus]KZX10281.1 hypothetical protein MBCUR_18480 [Methanobrevibacter curvatus]
MAIRSIKKLPKDEISILLESIDEIQISPNDSKILKGKLQGCIRKRKDPFRIVFKINKIIW